MNRMNKRMMLLSIAVLLVATLLFGCGQKDKEPEAQPAVTLEEFRASVDENQVVAELEGTTLTYKEMLSQLEAEDILDPGIGEAAVNNSGMLANYAEDLVIRKTMYEQAVAADFAYDEEVLEREMAALLAAYSDLTEEQQQSVRNLIDFYVMITEYLNSQITDEQTLAFYEENQSEFTTASVRHILIKPEAGRTEEDALEIATNLTERIRQGEDMAALATEHTEDPGSQANGGLYADQPVMMWVPEFKEAALTFELNEVGDPVKTDHGYHVIRVESRSVTPYDHVEAMLKDSMAAEKFWDFLESNQGLVVLSL